MTTTTQTGEAILENLLAEIHATDPEMLPPPYKREEGEKVLGILTDPTIQKVFSLSSFYRREAKRLEVDHEAGGIDSKNNPEFLGTKDKHDALQELFWYLLRIHMNFPVGAIGIRRGWEVVKTKDSDSGGIEIDPAKLPAFLKKLLGE